MGAGTPQDEAPRQGNISPQAAASRPHPGSHPAAGSTGGWRGTGGAPPGMAPHTATAPSDFSNCSSRLDRSVASIPGSGRKHGKSGQSKPSRHHRDASQPHPPPVSASPGDVAGAGEEKQQQSPQQLHVSCSGDRSTRLCSLRKDQFGHSKPSPATGGNVLAGSCEANASPRAQLCHPCPRSVRN